MRGRGAGATFEYCKYHPCIYDETGFCVFLQGECKREVRDKRCIHFGFYLKCAYASYHNGVLRCGFDAGETKKYVPGLPDHKYKMKLAVDDLKECLKQTMLKRGWGNRSSRKERDYYYD